MVRCSTHTWGTYSRCQVRLDLLQVRVKVVGGHVLGHLDARHGIKLELSRNISILHLHENPTHVCGSGVSIPRYEVPDQTTPAPRHIFTVQSVWGEREHTSRIWTFVFSDLFISRQYRAPSALSVTAVTFAP